MQTFICNVCERPLEGAAFEFSSISGRPVAGEQGLTRITHREHLVLLHLCNSCGSWLRLGIKTIGESLAAATALRNDPRWFDPTSVAPGDSKTNNRMGSV